MKGKAIVQIVLPFFKIINFWMVILVESAYV